MARWTATQELEAARAMRAAEAKALELICEIDVARPILAERSKRQERTNSASIDRLERAVTAAFQTHRKSKKRTLRAAVRQATHQIAISHELRWSLAMSARHIARGEARKMAPTDEDEKDLLQVGIEGLLDAAKRFDPVRKLRFTTYARWWVVARITRYFNPYPVKVSPNFRERHGKIRKTIRKLEKMGIDWTTEEVADHTGYTVKQVQTVLNTPLKGVSLSTPIGDGPRQQLLEDRLADDNPVDPTLELNNNRRQNWLKDALKQLGPRQRHVLARRYGLDDGTWRTLSAVGREISLSRERVRQIEAEALSLLRNLQPPGLTIAGALAHEEPQPPKKNRSRTVLDTAILDAMPLEPISKAALTEDIYGVTTESRKRQILAALKRWEKRGHVRRSGKGLSTQWQRLCPVLAPPEKSAPWKERIDFVLIRNSWLTSGKIADQLDERERLNSLSATLSLLTQSGHYERRPKGRGYEYALTEKSSTSAAA